MRHVIPTGVVRDDQDELEVFADSSGIQIKTRSGFAMVRGSFFDSTAQETIALTTPHASLPRIDTIILKLDLTANTVTLTKKDGTPAASPVAPTLDVFPDTSATVHEFPLADVLVNNGAVTIEANKVTDRRTLIDSVSGATSGLTLLHSEVLTVAGSFDVGAVTALPAGYAALELVASLRGTSGGAFDEMLPRLRFNNDSGANYSWTSHAYWDGDNSAADGVDTSIQMTDMPASGATGNSFGALHIIIPDYDQARHKTLTGTGGASLDTGNDQQISGNFRGTWRSTAAITRVGLFPASGSWAIGSSLRIYGKAAA